jgi:hypothetical protein
MTQSFLASLDLITPEPEAISLDPPCIDPIKVAL